MMYHCEVAEFGSLVRAMPIVRVSSQVPPSPGTTNAPPLANPGPYAPAAAEAVRLAILRLLYAAVPEALTNDAARFAAADRADYQRRRASGPDAVQQLLRDMSEVRRLELAETVAQDPDPRISELGIDVLQAAGRRELMNGWMNAR